MAEQALVRGDAGGGALDLAAGRLTPELPGDLADLGDGLRRDRFAEGGEATARVHGDAATELGVAVVQEALGLAGLAESDVLVPVEFERGRQVVDLGERQVLGAWAIEALNRSSDWATTAAESVAMSGRSITVFGYVGVTVDTAATRTGAPAEPEWRAANSIDERMIAAPPSDVAQISSR